MLRTLASLRLPSLVFSVPYTLLWARSMPGEDRAVSGALLVVAHAALLLVTLLVADRRRAEAGRDRHLPLVRSLDRADPALLDGAVGLLTLVLAFLALLLVVLDWPAAAALAGFSLVGLWHAGRPLRTQRVGIELLAPLFVLVAPMLLVAAAGWTRTVACDLETNTPPEREAMSAAVAGATLLGGAALTLLLLLMLRRDAPVDSALDERTTATARPPVVVGALVWLWMAGVALLAAMGAGWGWWHWSVAAAAGVGGAAVASASASHAHDRAVGVWFIAHALMAAAVCVTAA